MMRGFIALLVLFTASSCAGFFTPSPHLNCFSRTSASRRAHHVAMATSADEDGLVNKISVAVKNSPLNQFKQFIAKLGAGEYDEGAVRQQIDGYIKGNNVMVFSWSRCPFCIKSKELLGSLMDASEYKVVELDQTHDGGAVRYELSQITGRTSMPQVWVGGEFVGGCNDGPGVVPLHAQGRLVPMLQEAGCSVKAAAT